MSEIASTAVHSHGSYIEKGGVQIANILSINGPSRSKSTNEATHLNSPNRFAEFKSSIRDGGELGFTINYVKDDAGHSGLLDWWLADDAEEFTIVDELGTDGPFDGILTGFEDTRETGELVEAEITIKFTGDKGFV